MNFKTDVLSLWHVGLSYNNYCNLTYLGVDYMENFSPANRAEKKSRLHEIFHPGLKLKSEVNSGRNLSVGFAVLTICIFPRLSTIFPARTEIFSCDYMGFFSPGSSNRAEIQPGLKFSSCNRELCFLSILLEGRAKISARAEILHVINPLEIIPSFHHISSPIELI